MTIDPSLSTKHRAESALPRTEITHLSLPNIAGMNLKVERKYSGRAAGTSFQICAYSDSGTLQPRVSTYTLLYCDTVLIDQPSCCVPSVQLPHSYSTEKVEARCQSCQSMTSNISLFVTQIWPVMLSVAADSAVWQPASRCGLLSRGRVHIVAEIVHYCTPFVNSSQMRAQLAVELNFYGASHHFNVTLGRVAKCHSNLTPNGHQSSD
jgi:hypothetical protein